MSDRTIDVKRFQHASFWGAANIILAVIWPLHAFAQPGACEVKLVRELGTGSATISPDGELLAFWKPDGPLVVQEVATGRQVTGMPGPVSFASLFSQDGWNNLTISDWNKGTSTSQLLKAGKSSLSISGKETGIWVLGNSQRAVLSTIGTGASRIVALTDGKELLRVEAPLALSTDEHGKVAIVYEPAKRDFAANRLVGGSSRFKILSVDDKSEVAAGDAGMIFEDVMFITEKLLLFSNDQDKVLWDIASKQRRQLPTGYAYGQALQGNQFLALSSISTDRKPILIVPIDGSSPSYPLPGTEGASGLRMPGESQLAAFLSSPDKTVVFDAITKKTLFSTDSHIVMGWWGPNAAVSNFVTQDGSVLDNQGFKGCQVPEQLDKNRFDELAASIDGKWIVTKVGGNYKIGKTVKLWRVSGTGDAAQRLTAMKQQSAALTDGARVAVITVFKQAFELFQDGEFGAAEQQFLKGLAIDPANPSANFYLAETYARLNKPGQAGQYYRYTIEFGSGGKEATIAADRLAAGK